MKKKKLGLLVNIAVLCLCVAAIAIGVYSAKNANLNVGGTVGFNAHDCMVDVTATILGDSAGEDGSFTEFGVPRTTPKNVIKNAEIVSINGSNATMELEKFYFCDMTEDDSVNDITIIFTLTNKSLFEVDANIKNTSIKLGENEYSNITATPSESIKLGKLGENEATNNLTLTLKLNSKESISGELNITITIDTYKTALPARLTYSPVSETSSGLANTLYKTYKTEDGTSVYLGGSNIQTLMFSSNELDLEGYNKLVTDNVMGEDIDVYSKLVKSNLFNNKYNVIIYSPLKIYAPADCTAMFYETNIEKLVFNNFFTNDVTNMTNMFSSCNTTTLEGVDTWDVGKVNNMSGMFNYCQRMSTLEIASWNVKNVTNMSYMFYYC